MSHCSCSVLGGCLGDPAGPLIGSDLGVRGGLVALSPMTWALLAVVVVVSLACGLSEVVRNGGSFVGCYLVVHFDVPFLCFVRFDVVVPVGGPVGVLG